MKLLDVLASRTALRLCAIACLLVIVLALVTACAAVEKPVAVNVPVATPVEVKVAIPVPCVDRKDVPAMPAIPTNEALRALDDYDLLLTIERVRRDLAAYARKADAILAGCTK